MGDLFSKMKGGNAPSATAVKKTQHVSQMDSKDKAVFDLKIARDRLEKFSKKNEAQRDTYVQKAKALLGSGKRDRAKMALQMKRYIEKELDKIDAQLINLHQLVASIEWAETQVQVVQGLEAGNKALQHLNALTPLEKVEALMDDTAEAVQAQQEISDLLSGDLTAEDDSEILAELAALDGTASSTSVESLPEAPVTVNLPEAPTHEAAVQQEPDLTPALA